MKLFSSMVSGNDGLNKKNKGQSQQVAVRDGRESLVAARGLGTSRDISSFWNKDVKCDFWHSKWELMMHYLLRGRRAQSPRIVP